MVMYDVLDLLAVAQRLLGRSPSRSPMACSHRSPLRAGTGRTYSSQRPIRAVALACLVVRLLFLSSRPKARRTCHGRRSAIASRTGTLRRAETGLRRVVDVEGEAETIGVEGGAPVNRCGSRVNASVIREHSPKRDAFGSARGRVRMRPLT